MHFWKHLHTINHHRWLVCRYCFRLGLYWQGLTHDLSKYSPREFWVGVRYFQGDHSPNDAERKAQGYVPQRYYARDPVLARCLDALRTGFRDGVRYDDLYQRLLFGAGGSPADEYFLLADFQAYCQAEKRMAETYRDQTAWNRMSLHNIARSGVFAADRAVAEYADNIWHVPHK